VNKTAEHKYSLKFYFNDQFKWNDNYVMGIPDQRNPSWDAYQSSPLTVEASQYLKNGYAYLQN
jgi:hypothetical protein